MTIKCVDCDNELVVVGAGPAGLSVAIATATEGLQTTIVDASMQPGGQAGTSSLIENYPAFPEGVTGEELAGRLVDQATRFDVRFDMPTQVVAIERKGNLVVLVTDSGREVVCMNAVIATGVSYRLLRAKNINRYLGRGISYGSPPLDARRYQGQLVGIVGGGNSAGQAAVHMARCKGCTVHMFVRSNLAKSMSRYLIDKIRKYENIIVHEGTEIEEVVGDSRFTGVVTSGEDVDLDSLFILIGAEPKTGWLRKCLALNDHGFVLTDRDLRISEPEFESTPEEFSWRLDRKPYQFETSFPGVFAVGDVRYGSVKRVAAAVGEGANVFPSLHAYRHRHGI